MKKRNAFTNCRVINCREFNLNISFYSTLEYNTSFKEHLFLININKHWVQSGLRDYTKKAITDDEQVDFSELYQ